MKKVFKTMAFTLLGLVLSVNLWAVDETVTFTFTDKDNLQGWTSNPAPGSFESASPSRGLAWSKAAITSFSYTLSDYGVSKVSIVASANNAGYTLFVNGGEGQAIAKSTSNTTFNFDVSVAKGGTITISTTKGSDVKSFWIKSITLTKTAGDDPSCTSRTITFAGSPTTVEKTTADVPFKYTASIDVADGQTIGYSSSDTKVATVAADGTVTIVGAGTTEITASVPATDTYCEASASYTVNVTKPVFSCWEGSLNCDFTKISDWSKWGSGYSQHVVNYTNLTVTFANANKNSSTITDCPVTKGSDVTFVAAEKKVITQIHVNCKQWSDKKQTITLNYSTDGGTNYQTLTPSVTSDDFEIESTNLPEGTNAVKLTFSNSSNQIGIASACVTIEDAPTLNSISVKTAPKLEYNANETFNPAGLVINAVYSNGTKEIAYAGNESDFTFSPTLSTLLTSENTQVTITYKNEKSTTQDITVNLLPTTLTLAAAIQNIGAGEVVSDLTTWVASVTGGDSRTLEFTSDDEDVFYVDGTEGMAGDNAGQTTVTVKAVATNIYAEATEEVTVNVLSATDPKLEVDPTIVEFTNKVVGQSYTSDNIVLTGENLTANATIEISGTDAEMFTAVDGEGNAISSIEQADGEILADIYVKYAPTAGGTHSATMTISSTTANVEVTLNGSAKASYTVKWSINGDIDESKNETVVDGNTVTIVPTAESCDEDNIAFLGWTNNTITDAAEAPAVLFTNVATAPAVTDNVTYHAVFAEIGGSGEMKDKLITSAEYDTWTYSGSTTNMTPSSGAHYRLFGENAYVETAEFDLSKITKVSVYGGSYGGDTYKPLVIKGNVGGVLTTWKDAAVSDDKQTTRNDFTVESNPLSGIGKLRVIAKKGNGAASGSNGLRMTKVEVYTQEKDITYSHYSTTCVPPLVAPTLTEGGEFCTSVNVTIGKGENPDGVTLMYSTDGGASWTPYSKALPISNTTTIKAKAVMSPKESEPAEATYTILPHYSDLTALKATATADAQKACVSFSNLLVNATNVYTVYLTDGTNVYMINKNNHGFSRGQKLSTGEHAILPYKLFNGVLEFTDNAGITAAEGTFETPATTMAVDAIAASNYGQLVKIENVIYNATDGVFTDASSNTIKLGNNIVNASSWVKDGAKYDITGIITTQTVEEVTSIFISPRAKDLDVVSKAEKLNAPSNLTYENLTGSSVTLKWGEVTGAEKYDVEVYAGSTRVKNQQTTSLSYGPTGLTSGTTYTWRVRAVGNDLTTATSDWTDGTATFTTPAPATLYWIVNGDIEHPFATTTAASEKVVMPTTDPTSACDENYEDFICWVNRPVEGVQTRAPFNYELVADTSKAKSADGDKYFYALFGKVASEGTDVYTLVTEAPDSWTGDYLIAQSESKFANGYYSGTNGIGKEGNYVDLSESIVDNTIAGEIGNPYHVTFETCEGGYLMKSQSGYYNYRSANSNGLDSTANVNTADDYPITIALNDGGTVHMSLTNGVKFQYNNGGSGYFRFYKSDSEQSDCYLYKRTLTPKTYSAYITTCPTFYDITIADGIVGGSVDADPQNTIDAGTTIQLTADADAGYTAEGGKWTVTNETTTEAITVNKSNQFKMPASNVTVSYAFVALEDKFNDALHGAAEQKGVGAQYDLPTLANTTEGTRKDAYFKFAGWVPATTEITTGEPATEKPTILEGKQDATGVTYKALWANAAETAFITEECGTAIPTNLHVVNDALTANSAKLDWNNVTGATLYHVSVYKATDLVDEANVESSEYVVTGLTAATEYTFTVKAFKGCWGYEATSDPFTTKAEIASHSVTLVAENGQIEIDPDLTDGKLNEGTVATVTATADEGYYFVDWNFTNVTPTSKDGNVATFAMPTKAITITANFAEYPAVTWKMEGAADVVTPAVLKEDKFEVGTIQSAPADWKYKTYFPEFAGWVTSDKCDADGNVTIAEFISSTTEVPADGLTVYGAVAKSSAPDCSTATKITSNENLDMSALYVIGAEYDEATLYYTGIDGTWGKMTNDVTQTVPMIINISGTANALALIQSDGKYIEPCTSNSFAVSDEQKLVVMNENGDLTYNNTRLLTYNHNSGSGGIRWYASTSSNPKAYLYKVALAYENLTIDPQPDYGRTDLVVGNYGTVCVPYTVTAADRSGATFWNIETSDAIGSTNPTSVTIVEETDYLVAGKPYIFCATDTKMALFFSGEEYKLEDHENTTVKANGLFGNLTDGTITINETGYVPGYFFVLQQKLYECGVNCTVGPSRGWVQADQIGVVQAPINAPRRVIGNPNGTPTGINNLNVDGWVDLQGAHKFFHNNHIVIVNEGRIYNAQGIRIQ